MGDVPLTRRQATSLLWDFAESHLRSTLPTDGVSFGLLVRSAAASISRDGLGPAYAEQFDEAVELLARVVPHGTGPLVVDRLGNFS